MWLAALALTLRVGAGAQDGGFFCQSCTVTMEVGLRHAAHVARAPAFAPQARPEAGGLYSRHLAARPASTDLPSAQSTTQTLHRTVLETTRTIAGGYNTAQGVGGWGSQHLDNGELLIDIKDMVDTVCTKPEFKRFRKDIQVRAS